MGIRETIVGFMKEQAYKPMDIQELSRMFGVRKADMKDFQKIIKSMEKEGLIVRTRTDHFGVPDKMGLVTGKLQAHPRGFGFVLPEEERPDVFIPGNAMNGAMHGDRVIAKVTREEGNGKKCEGEIIRILERGITKTIGIYEDSRNFGFVVSDDKRIHQDIFIPKADRNGAESGQIVVVEITKWPEKRRNPEGRIVEILGNKGDRGIDILTIIKKHNLPEEFPEKVIGAAEMISEEIPSKEYERRMDLRHLKIVTIDGEDAKDLDDAVSIEKKENGNYYLGVHIADVTNYVKEKGALDKEALKRATSVYLIDRVIPMLPRKLSNGICSLNPKVDRLTLSCFMEIDKKGKVVDYKIAETIIKTTERMTYTDVTKILRDKDEETIERYKHLYDEFIMMEELCGILNKKRLDRGAIDFDFAECKVILNEHGKPVEIKPYERAIANRVIEEFMLVCNETVAEYMFWANMPFVYRVHEDPDEEKLQNFNEFVYNLGYFVRMGKDKIHPKDLQDIVAKAKGKDEEVIVNTLLLRSMKQARYSPECIGHFGLAAKYYCHFTSPIRRYPDLMIHRIIKQYINGGMDDTKIQRFTKDVDVASMQSSEMERVAQEAEREVDDLKKAEYMSERIGQEFDGVISSVTNFGIFIQLPNTVEGLVHISDLDDDYYVFDEKTLSLIGERKKKIYRLGDKRRVVVSKVDLASYEIYFDIVNTEVEEEPKIDTTQIPELPIHEMANEESLDLDEELFNEISKEISTQWVKEEENVVIEEGYEPEGSKEL